MTESEERIWGIRDLIQRQEDVKDHVTALFGAEKALDEASRGVPGRRLSDARTRRFL